MSHFRGKVKTRVGNAGSGGTGKGAGKAVRPPPEVSGKGPMSGKSRTGDAASDFPYDGYYSNLFSPMFNAPTGVYEGSDSTVDLTTLKKMQRDLQSLVKSSRKRSRYCREEAQKMELLKEKLAAKLAGNKGNGEEEAGEAMDVDDSGARDEDMEKVQEWDGDESMQFDETRIKKEDEGEVRDMTGLQAATSGSSPRELEEEEEHNPQGDFIEAQTIPIAALGLFQEQDPELPQHGEEYKKKKYGVVSYPTTDLKDMLPGEIPDEDFTRAKPSNQVQFSTFLTAIEPFFKPYSEEEISVLKQRAVGGDSQYSRLGLANPYTIPRLGPLYTETWAQEDGNNAGYTLSPPPPDNSKEEARGNEEMIVDGVLGSGEQVSCGPLAARLLSALLPETHGETGNNIEDELDTIDEDDNSERKSQIIDATWQTASIKNDFQLLEDRLKKEFRYVGILDVNMNEGKEGDIDWVNDREDDEVCYELRLLQKKLRQTTRVNQACKRRLLPIVQEQMAYQEYSTILEDLDKQVDQAYIKRFRNPKPKKKKGVATTSIASQQQSVEKPTNVKALVEKRQRWIDKIGPVFPPSTVMKRVPKESIFKDLQFDDDDDDFEEYE